MNYSPFTADFAVATIVAAKNGAVWHVAKRVQMAPVAIGAGSAFGREGHI